MKHFRIYFPIIMAVVVCGLWCVASERYPVSSTPEQRYDAALAEQNDGVPLLTIPKSEWPQKAIDASKSGLPWGQCKDCGKIVIWNDVGDGAAYTTGTGGLEGFYCKDCTPEMRARWDDDLNEPQLCADSSHTGTITCLVYGCDGKDCTTCMECGLKIRGNQ